MAVKKPAIDKLAPKIVDPQAPTDEPPHQLRPDPPNTPPRPQRKTRQTPANRRTIELDFDTNVYLDILRTRIRLENGRGIPISAILRSLLRALEAVKIETSAPQQTNEEMLTAFFTERLRET